MRRLVLALSVILSGPLAAQSTPNRTGIYANPAEPGYGLFVVQAGDLLVPAWYTYDSDGKPLWFLISGAERQADGSYVGGLYRYTGAPFSQTVANAVNSTTQAGTARLRYTSADTIDFSYTIGTLTQTKSVSRFNLSTDTLTCAPTTASRASATNYTDLWWNPAQQGWGLNIVHQGEVIFFGWYTYGPDQRPMWVTGTGQRQANGSYSGDLNRPLSGTPLSQINGSPATSFPVPKVGTFSLSFSNGENASFNWTLDGVTQTRALTRFAFGSPATVCTSTPAGGGGGSNFTTNQCGRVYRVGDEWTYRYGDGREERNRVVADGTFNGQSVRIVEGYDSQNRLISKSYYRILPNAMATVASESFDTASGSITSRLVYTPAIEVPVTLTPGQTLSLSYRGDGTTFGAQASTAVYNYQQQIRILGRENVTVPAGSFAQACDMEVTTTGSAVVAGFSVPIPPTTARAFVTDAAPNGIKGNAGTGVGNATFEMQSFRNGN